MAANVPHTGRPRGRRSASGLRLRIAEVAPLFVRIPPENYGGTERVVHALSEGLVKRGNQVTLFGPGGSETSAQFRAVSPAPLWEMDLTDPLAYRALQVEEVVRESGDFHVIHSHVDSLPWLAGGRLQAPVITTLNGRLDLPEWRPLACRQWASERFSTERMVGDYEKVVRRVAGWEHLVA